MPSTTWMRWIAACVFVQGAGSAALAADFSALVVGTPVSESTRIGRYDVATPPGNWTVAAKFQARMGSDNAGSSTPVQLSLALVNQEVPGIKGVVFVRTPSTTFVGISRWNDDPCKSFASAVVKDTLKQTFTMPECFAIEPYSGARISGATEGLTGGVAQWLRQSGQALPEKLWRIFYAKYAGGDFMVINAYMPATSDSHAAAEAWGRQLVAAVQPMVTRSAPQAVLPPFP